MKPFQTTTTYDVLHTDVSLSDALSDITADLKDPVMHMFIEDGLIWAVRRVKSEWYIGGFKRVRKMINNMLATENGMELCTDIHHDIVEALLVRAMDDAILYAEREGILKVTVGFEITVPTDSQSPIRGFIELIRAEPIIQRLVNRCDQLTFALLSKDNFDTIRKALTLAV